MSKHDVLPFEVTLDVRDHCLCFHMQRAARAVARLYDEVLRPVELTNGQFSLLMALNRPQPPSLGEISLLLGMDRTTVTANLKPLGRRGLLKVTIDPADRRGRLLHILPKGRMLLAAALPLWKEAQVQLQGRLKKKNPDRLRADLRAIS